MPVAPREKRNRQPRPSLALPVTESCLHFSAEWGGEWQLSALGDPKLDFRGGGWGGGMELYSERKHLTPTHSSAQPSTRPHRTFPQPPPHNQWSHPSPWGKGSSFHCLTPGCHRLRPVPMVPTRLHQVQCPLALPQDKPGTQPPLFPGVGWLSLTGWAPGLGGVDPV